MCCLDSRKRSNSYICFIAIGVYCAISIDFTNIISPREGELFPVTVSQLSCLIQAKWSHSIFMEGRKTIRGTRLDISIEDFAWIKSYIDG